MFASTKKALHSSQQIRRLLSTTQPRLSHIGSKPIKYTGEVQIEHIPKPPSNDPRLLHTTTLRVVGPLGERTMPIEPFVRVSITQAEESQLNISVVDAEEKKQRQMWGTTRALANNMVVGVTEGFSATLRFVGVGYRAALENGVLVLRLGFSHPVRVEIPQGLRVVVPVPTRVLVSGTDLQQVKLFAAKVREWKKPEPYNQKGIFINDETIRKKDGKKK
ncbi:54S ribosomal protein L6 mitochondrial [Coemansia spiralis]|uniref:54S ribosomal protein L6 mitochondrial n=2 Tax=Coemansia TaxID=4863 RepID=A0A9W8G395_9FUNG|nr:ribosomal protein L6, alpha-beta domain-containing protein [Coemansia spiralis]KAJ1988622.1 54S ribosomal protein L6 mitochondrial [Coemansia umbellata]KAJ2622443.1 54S ribosomal protein L6 mitochondrial [Coemansia sp. RSA 1358]KAJ2672897.1 54S ribosomal protein L6 mitochondrial [Coemansia spiralis]